MAIFFNFLNTPSKAPRPENRMFVALGWIALLISFCLILGISMMSTSAPTGLNNMDKLYHAGAYAVLTGAMIMAWPKRALPLILAIAFLAGAAIEVLQGTIAVGRTASIYDALANGAGAIAVILLWYGFYIWVRPSPV